MSVTPITISGIKFIVETSGLDEGDRDQGIEAIRDRLLHVADVAALTEEEIFDIGNDVSCDLKVGWNFNNPAANHAGFCLSRAE